MEDHRSTSRRGDAGFTLVELLIVIVILGVLSTVTVLSVRGLTGTAKLNACETEQRVLETAVDAYFASEGVESFGTVAPGTALVPQFMRAESTMYTVNADGTLTAIAGNTNGCV